MFIARVIENKTFLKEGFIWVRLDLDTSFNGDLSAEPDKSFKDFKDEEDKLNFYRGGCVKAYVSSPFGGGKGYGMFHLPQVNSRCIVDRLANTADTYIYMGTIFMYLNKDIDLPEENGIHNPNIEKNEDKIDNLDNALVIVTKRTIMKDPLNPMDSQKDIDWIQRPVENVAVFDNEKIYVAHNILNSDNKHIGTLQMQMDENGIGMFYDKDKYNGNMMVVIDQDSKLPKISLQVMDSNNEESPKICSIDGTSKNLTIMVKDGDEQQLIELNSQNEGDIDTRGIKLQSKAGVINLGNKDISITGTEQNVNIAITPGEGGKVNIGGGGNAVLVETKGESEGNMQPSQVLFA